MKPFLLPPAFALLVAASCTPGDVARTGGQGSDPSGRLVIVGGALQAENAPVYEATVEARLGDGPLCVIPTASGSPDESMTSAVETLEGYAGSEAVRGIPISTERPELARSREVAAELASCSGFYFTGGSQSRVVDVFLPDGDTTVAYRAVWDRWRDGAVLAGTSAGAAMMSRVMIASGGPDEAVAEGVATEDGADGVRIRGGMGFFPRAMVDQHFLARGRIGRLLVAVLATDSLPLGLGIDENTALIVDDDSAVVAGASGVVVVDGRGAERLGSHRGRGLRVTLAGAGDVLDLRTFEVRRAGGKRPVPVAGSARTLPEDPFDRWAFLHLMAELASGEDSMATFELEGAVLTIRKGEGFSASMTAAEGGVEGTPAGLSAGPFVVDLVDGGMGG